jgi:hypothetical protein
LQANPSANSVNELYSFMSYKSLANTSEGKVLGYKGVQSDYWSTTGNADTIVLQGETNDRHQILNEVGATIEVARRCVDDNKDNHCSFGLHVGSFDYADSWAGEGGRLLLVEFDPADAVSVPTDCDFQKLRVSKYKVISDISDTRKELNKPVYEANKPIYGSDDDEDFGGHNEDDSDYVDMESNIDDGSGIEYDDDNWEQLGEEVLEEDMDQTEKDISEYIETYINNKHDNSVNPTLKNIADLRACKNERLTCKEIYKIVDDLNFVVEEDDNKPLNQLRVL